MKLFKISAWLDDRGFGYRIHENDVTETEKSFVYEGHRISKDRLMEIDTHFVETHDTIRYFIICKDGEQEQALDMLKKHIIEKITLYKSKVDNLYKFVVETKENKYE